MNNVIDLDRIKKEFDEDLSKINKRIIICAGTACVANGSLKIMEALAKKIKEKNLNVTLELNKESNDLYISKSGCQGFCQMGPLVTILPDNILYTKVKTDDVDEIVEKTIINNTPIDRLLYKNPKTKNPCLNQNEIEFYTKQHRFVLKNCGVIDPEDINEYISTGGYYALKKVIFDYDEDRVIKEITDSGLKGRGGGGFLTGKKWELTKKEKSAVKYIICNGDEGDPGAFMDRSVMEGNPHSVIEGMCIAAKAIGASSGYVYVRTEYPLAVKRMKKAVNDARRAGILGENIFNTGKSFDISVMEGAGAFVCGEETALISSIEGDRGMPSPKPPYPAASGLLNKPTLINNVETFATVPLIINMGAKEFSKIGVENSKGTKTFALTGHVANTGLIEVPLGTTIRHIVDEIAGGVTDNKGRISLDNFKAVQIGGPSGGCLTKEHLDVNLDFESLKKVNAMIGSGGLVVMNNNTCMVRIAKFFMHFTQNESCGKCVLCREGTKQMLNILEDITEGRADENTLPLLEELAHAVKKGSLCGLGKTAPNPVLSTLKYFKDEYIAHINHKKCPAGECKELIDITIDEKLCKGCTLCAKKCPVQAISGKKGKPHFIDKDLCIKCGICIDTCKFKAVIR
jgi:NADH-quinone oxidoreductase subunit F